MTAAGFRLQKGRSGRSSGGNFAQASYVKGDRILELHFRFSLGLVRYHIGTASISHEDYMRVAVSGGKKNLYPGFSGEPLDGFRWLVHDLKNFAADFLKGSGELFDRALLDAERRAALTPMQRLAENGG